MYKTSRLSAFSLAFLKANHWHFKSVCRERAFDAVSVRVGKFGTMSGTLCRQYKVSERPFCIASSRY